MKPLRTVREQLFSCSEIRGTYIRLLFNYTAAGNRMKSTCSKFTQITKSSLVGKRIPIQALSRLKKS